ncbi:PREDICTED: uncharacterized protein LOC104806301 [Tarenaya hassleriana]|uniref:uncharacterized protein LOC104806301 n=1 Tax=Tarenaya hassleriana TaxID=28532 RepID=UPI00053C5389|nr:PREDICTED: uncharacterized protein LOC104806301 [Tarenaya hassleriana]XP_010529434.1 PREDICTED: uncharacterized protein LOC104806301 [Tarenaya hassleriana]XP_010529435.1 PREDICTED: uncharacterized protein LOC104806301 [Tarenaya hassleriana]
MDPMNRDSGSTPATDPPVKRKRGRPSKDESLHQQEKPDNMSTDDAVDNMMGQVVSGVVEGSFDAGYFISVNAKDTDKELRGIVFIPDKVTPITAENDVAPHAKMYGREEIAVPSTLDHQTQPREQSGGLDNVKNQSESCMASCPHDQPMKDTGTATDMQIKDIGEKVASVQVPEYEAGNRALSLMPEAGNGDFSKQDEASGGNDKSETDTTRFVDFFPSHEKTQQQAMGSGSDPSLVLFQNETKTSRTEQQKSPACTEPHGFNLLTEKPDTAMENVPEGLQLELGNKTMSGANMGGNTPEANPQLAASKSGFLINLFDAAKPEASVSESGFMAALQADISTNKNVDCNMEEEAIPNVPE